MAHYVVTSLEVFSNPDVVRKRDSGSLRPNDVRLSNFETKVVVRIVIRRNYYYQWHDLFKPTFPA